MIANIYIVCLQQFFTLVAPDGAIEVCPLGVFLSLSLSARSFPSITCSQKERTASQKKKIW